MARLNAFINSLAVGAAVGTIGYLSFGAIIGILKGVLGFVISFAIFEFVRRIR